MDHVAGLIGLAIALFASTNVDDLFVLLGFFSDPRYRPFQIVIGQYVGIGLLFGLSVAASLISLIVAPAYVGLLGLAPIAIGLKKLWDIRSRGESEEPADDGRSGSNIFAVAAVTTANGGDNISIYTPLFAIRQATEVALIGVVFAVMTAVWLTVAYKLTTHPDLGAPIRRYGHRIVPFVLIGLGILILVEAGTFRLLRGAP